MERPPKRPRFGFFDQRELSGKDLEDARYNNDLTLKSRFEAIFAKYSQDFTDVGDEVDLMTGEVIINRGHLEKLETETDTGQKSSNGDAVDGRSLLHAFATEEQDDDGMFPRPDDVLESIEVVAENIGLMDGFSTESSEDNLFDVQERPSHSTSRENDPEQFWSETPLEPYDSDADSLFERERHPRSRSVDSLFEHDTPVEAYVQHQLQPFKASEMRSSHDLPSDDMGILQRFGPEVGQEVLELLDQRQDAHIEPAWQIPVRIDYNTRRGLTPPIITSLPIDVSPGQKQHTSLWTAPKRSLKRTLRRPKVSQPSKPRMINSLRDESEDPLQEGFSSRHGSIAQSNIDGIDENVPEQDIGEYYQSSEREYLNDVDERDESTVAKEELLERISDTCECPYCHTRYAFKSGVMAHWDRLLKQYSHERKPEDPHDEAFMRAVRINVTRRNRPPRLVLYDFRTMVELHEGAGYSFEQIAQKGVLRTHKDGPRLQDVYDMHRAPTSSWQDSEPKTEWTPEDKTSLFEMSKNSLVTMATIRRGLGDRYSDVEIGNRLADMWLALLRSQNHRDNAQTTPFMVLRRKFNRQGSAEPELEWQQVEDTSDIKEEPVEDSL